MTSVLIKREIWTHAHTKEMSCVYWVYATCQGNARVSSNEQKIEARHGTSHSFPGAFRGNMALPEP